MYNPELNQVVTRLWLDFRRYWRIFKDPNEYRLRVPTQWVELHLRALSILFL